MIAPHAKTDVLARIALPQLVVRDAAARTHDFDGREAKRTAKSIRWSMRSWPPDYSVGHHGRVGGEALRPRLFAARLWINVTASHVSEDLSKNRSAPSRRLRFSYSVFA